MVTKPDRDASILPKSEFMAAVGTLLFGGGLAVVPAATYSLIMFATALIFIAFLRRAHPTG